MRKRFPHPMRGVLRARANALLLGLGFALAGPAGPGPARAAGERPTPAPAPALRDVARDFETRRLLPGKARATFLQGNQQAVAAALAGDLGAEERWAARFLAGSLSFELGDYRAAGESFAHAAETAEKGGFGADAEFARIQALEAAGADESAAREWAQWRKRYPESPLQAEARLAEARNALRRGRSTAAESALAGLVARSPWMQADARVVLARALAAYLDHRPADALARLGPAPASAGAIYLGALCQQALGARLKAAAGFQQAAERVADPSTPGESSLRDHALLAKANAFLTAHDDRSAAEEFARVAARVDDPGVRAEAELRGAGARMLAGQADSALVLLRTVARRYPGTTVAARALFLIGAGLASGGQE